MNENIIAHPIPWGVGSIILGIIVLLLNKKFPAIGWDITFSHIRGYIFGIVFIIIGMVIIIRAI